MSHNFQCATTQQLLENFIQELLDKGTSKAEIHELVDRVEPEKQAFNLYIFDNHLEALPHPTLESAETNVGNHALLLGSFEWDRKKYDEFVKLPFVRQY